MLLETELVRGHFQDLWMRIATQEQKNLKDKIFIPYHVSKNTCHLKFLQMPQVWALGRKLLASINARMERHV